MALTCCSVPSTRWPVCRARWSTWSTPSLKLTEHGAVLFQLSLNEPRLGGQLLHPLVQGHARALALLHRGLHTATHIRLHFLEPFLGKIPRALVGSIHRSQLAPERRDIPPRSQHVVVGCAAAKERHGTHSQYRAAPHPPSVLTGVCSHVVTPYDIPTNPQHAAPGEVHRTRSHPGPLTAPPIGRRARLTYGDQSGR